jgi:hypothetical protein
MPLELAVLLVREKVYRAGERNAPPARSDPDAIAGFIATMIPVYEYSADASVPPRMLFNVHRNSVFSHGGREVQFLDGRPGKRLLAVRADDVSCVVAMLKEPDRAEAIRREAVQRTARDLVDQSRRLVEEYRTLRKNFDALRAHTKELKLRSKEQTA